jgi:RNA polymerase sigma-70 factor, ECF subfamily
MGMLNAPSKVTYDLAARNGASVTCATTRGLVSGNSDKYAELTRLLEQGRPKLLRIALRFTRNMEDAEDVVQEASMKALIHLENFRRESRMDTWLYTIISNTAVNGFRSGLRRREVSLEYIATSNDNGERYSIRDLRRNPEQVCADRETHEMVCAEVKRLKDQHRKAVVLCDLDGLSHSEAADALNLNLRRFNTRLLRGRRVLCKRLRKREAARKTLRPR